MTRRPSRKSRPSARKPSASTGMSTGMERPSLQTNTERMKPVQVGLGSVSQPSYLVAVKLKSGKQDVYSFTSERDRTSFMNQAKKQFGSSNISFATSTISFAPQQSTDSKVYDKKKSAKTTTIDSVTARRFSDTASQEKPELKKQTVSSFLKEKYDNPSSFGTDNLTRTGTYKEMGWQYDFKPYLNRYVYKQYGSWNQIYAPNKTAVRKVTYGKIDEIKEL